MHGTVTCRNLLICLLSISVLGPLVAQEQSGGGARGVPSNYIVQPLDIFRVAIFQEPDLTSEVRVARDGTVVLPLIGQISVGGMTVQNVQTMIRDLYNRDYLVEPHVSILMLQYTERRVMIHGQVNRPGPVIIPPEEKMTLSQAIAAAGGVTRLGNSRDINLKRMTDSGRANVIRVNLDQILRDPDATDLEVQSGDDIFVPERIF